MQFHGSHHGYPRIPHFLVYAWKDMGVHGYPLLSSPSPLCSSVILLALSCCSLLCRALLSSSIPFSCQLFSPLLLVSLLFSSLLYSSLFFFSPLFSPLPFSSFLFSSALRRHCIPWIPWAPLFRLSIAILVDDVEKWRRENPQVDLDPVERLIETLDVSWPQL